MEIFGDIGVYLVLNYAMRFIGTPYIWGGNTRLDGFDCSGFVQEILWYGGVDPAGDQTAQALYNKLSKNEYRSILKPGSVLFFGQSRNSVSHIAIAVDHGTMIESGGGDRSCTTRARAHEKNAFVRLSPLNNRSDMVACLLPKYKI